MKKIVSLVLAALMLCSLAVVAFAATPQRWTNISWTLASATRTVVTADMASYGKMSLKITAQVYRYSSVADDYMRSVKFEESVTNDDSIVLYETYTLYQKDKVVFTFNAGGETHTETCYVK